MELRQEQELTQEQDFKVEQCAMSGQLNGLESAIKDLKVMVDNAKNKEDLDKAKTYFEYYLNTYTNFIKQSNPVEPTRQK